MGVDFSRPRRAALRVLSCALGMAVAPRWFVRAAQAQLEAQPDDRMSKARAEYQDTPNGIYSCATCTLFVPPAACKVVQGEVSPDGWCKAFAMAD